MGLTQLETLVANRNKLKKIEERILALAEKRDEIVAKIKELYTKVNVVDIKREIGEIEALLRQEEEIQNADADTDEG